MGSRRFMVLLIRPAARGVLPKCRNTRIRPEKAGSKPVLNDGCQAVKDPEYEGARVGCVT